MQFQKRFFLQSVFIPALFILVIFSSCSNGKFRGAVKEDGKYGYIDESGSYAIKPKYDQAWSFIRGSAVVKENGLYGLIDKNGKYLVEPTYDSIIPFSASCMIVSKDSMFGFIATGDGKIIINPQFEKVFYYTSRLCVVQKGNSLGIVNDKAKMVCPAVMQDFREMLTSGAICIQNDTSDEVSMLLSLINGGDGMKKGLLNSKGEVIVQPKYNDIFDDATNGFYYSFIADTAGGIPAEKENYLDEDPATAAGKYGIIDTAGKIISEPVFEEMPVYGDKMFRVKQNGKYGYANMNGAVIIPPAYDYAVAFSEGKAIVSIGKKASVIDNTGKILAEDLGPGAGMYRFFNGLARCRSVDGKYGFLDATGKRVIAPTLDVADDFENGRAIVSINNHYGLIDPTGKFIVPDEYDFLYDLGNGYYQAKKENGKAGVIDSLGHTILEPLYDEVFHLQKPYFTVEKDGLNGCYDLQGKEIYPPVSARGVYFYNGRCLVIKENKYGMIDSTGKLIIPTNYDSIGMFFKGRASVLSGRKFGAVDSTGTEIIKPKYQELRPFLNGFAVYKEKGKFGYLGVDGKVLTEAKFEEAAVLVDPERVEFE